MTTTMSENNILSPKQAAKSLTISMTTFWRLTKAGKINTVKVSSKRLGIYQSEIDRYLNELNNPDGFDDAYVEAWISVPDGVSVAIFDEAYVAAQTTGANFAIELSRNKDNV